MHERKITIRKIRVWKIVQTKEIDTCEKMPDKYCDTKKCETKNCGTKICGRQNVTRKNLIWWLLLSTYDAQQRRTHAALVESYSDISMIFLTSYYPLSIISWICDVINNKDFMCKSAHGRIEIQIHEIQLALAVLTGEGCEVWDVCDFCF